MRACLPLWLHLYIPEIPNWFSPTGRITGSFVLFFFVLFCVFHIFFSSNINYIYHPTYKTVMKVLLCTIIKVAGAKDKRTIVCVFLEVTALVFLYFSSLRLFPYFISKFSDSAKQGPGHLLRGEGWCEDKLTALYHFFVSRQKWVKWTSKAAVGRDVKDRDKGSVRKGP